MTPDSVRDSYRRSLALAGEKVTVRRYTGAGANRPSFEATVMARVTGYDPHELVGDIRQADRKVILLADDLVRRQFALPVKVDDKIVVRGRELNVEAADDSTRRVAGVLVAIEIRARG